MYRMLTDNERQLWSISIAETLTIVPYMRDLIANLKPIFTDEKDFIVGVDKHWRCAISQEFMDLNLSYRCGVIVHDAMHCINNHFYRAEILHGFLTERDNVAMDLEINTTIEGHLLLKLPEDALYPQKYELPKHESYEFYYNNLPKDKTYYVSGGGSNGDGKSIGKDLLDGRESEAITEAGLPEMSNAEKVTALNNTFQRAVEHQKSIGNAEGLKDNILQYVIKALTPAKVDWRSKLSNILSTTRYAIANRKTDYSYRKVNRRVGNKDIAPGSISYKPKVMLGIDVSGSVSEDEHLSMLAEIDDIIRQQSQNIEVFAMDTEMGDIQTVNSVNKIKLFNGGGTALECGFRYVKELPKVKRPDIFVVFSDGENYWKKCKEYILNSVKYIVISTQNSEYLKDIDFGEVIVIG